MPGDRGVVYQDEHAPRDALALLRDHGLNCVRLRLFTSSAQQASADPDNATNNLDYTLPLAVRVKNAGLRFLLDLHYSDSWADPAKQNKPSDWADLSFTQLETRIYEYTRDVVSSFRQAGATPDIVQVGNEIIGGLLWPEGRVGGSYDSAVQWSQLGRLLKPAIRGVHEGAGVLLTWPLSGAGMVLTTTLSLSNPGAWTPVNVAPQTDGLDYRATLPRIEPFRLYRLEAE